MAQEGTEIKKKNTEHKNVWKGLKDDSGLNLYVSVFLIVYLFFVFECVFDTATQTSVLSSTPLDGGTASTGSHALFFFCQPFFKNKQ